ncbi:DUF2690 domain-containing protein [Streptomyces sp. NPDC058157]|uniref:DUF2690 domain-containing protein n=1 Tax=Streptomyces sp. NPDC058157 TaxID=3346360 RepID=UPI0036EA7143
MWRKLSVTLAAGTIAALSWASPASAAGDGPEARAGATTAKAMAGCYGNSCWGKDPIEMGCNADAYTVESKSTTSGRIELRYSAACAANWARLVNGAGHQFIVQAPNGYASWVATSSNSWTDMVDGTVENRACLWGSDGAWTCTGWH